MTMNKELANELLKVFDTPKTVETICKYADLEIDKANVVLSTTTDTVEIYRLQGVIRSLKALKTVRKVAEDVIKMKD